MALSGTGLDFGISNTSGTLTVMAGTTATYTLNVSPLGSDFSSTVTLSCAGAPSGATCSVSPQSVAPGATTSAVKVSVATASTTASAQKLHCRGAAGVGLAGLLLLGFARGTAMRFATGPVCCCSLPARSGWFRAPTRSSSRGQPQGGTPAGSYILLVSGTAGNMTHTSTVALVVQ